VNRSPETPCTLAGLAGPLLVSVAAASLCLTGCSEEKFPLVPVSGRVTLDGEPLPDARVAFEPIAAEGESMAGPGSYATTDSQGRYSLKTLDGRTGAVVRKHRIKIGTHQAPATRAGTEMPKINEKVPESFNRDTTFDVPEGGTQSADFRISTKGEAE